jgi:hypothetical protein
MCTNLYISSYRYSKQEHPCTIVFLNKNESYTDTRLQPKKLVIGYISPPLWIHVVTVFLNRPQHSVSHFWFTMHISDGPPHLLASSRIPRRLTALTVHLMTLAVAQRRNMGYWTVNNVMVGKSRDLIRCKFWHLPRGADENHEHSQ